VQSPRLIVIRGNSASGKSLSRGYHTVVEGIFNADHYGPMLTALISDHADSAFTYFLDVPFSETLRRHATKTGTLKYGRPRCASGTAGSTCCPAASSTSYQRSPRWRKP
jgi:hypothetical protein